MLETTQEILTGLQRKGALQDEGRVLSRVIKDSMKLTQLLGERYLWVDVLRIVQDDNVNKMRHISNMDAIYKQASLTIVAHSGTSPDSPLPGVIEGTRFPIVTSRKVCGTHLICQLNFTVGFPANRHIQQGAGRIRKRPSLLDDCICTPLRPLSMLYYKVS